MKITRSALKQLIKEQMTLLQEDESQATLSGAEVPKYMFDGMERNEANAYMKSGDWVGARDGLGPRQGWEEGRGRHSVKIEGLAELSDNLAMYATRPVSLSSSGELDWSSSRRSVYRDMGTFVGFEIGFRATSDAIEKQEPRIEGEPVSDQHDSTVFVTAKLNSRGGDGWDGEAMQHILDTFNRQNGGKGGKMSVDGADQSQFMFGFGWDWQYST